MSNLFDPMQDAVFNTVTATFGDIAKWTPSTGGETFSASVLYKDPSAKYGIGESEFEVEEYFMEYKLGDLPGLKEAVNSGRLESLTITNRIGSLDFFVRKCTKQVDGKTIFALLNIK